MSNDVAPFCADRKIVVSEEQKKLVKSMVFPGSSDGELALYLFECERRGVHPLDRLIFPIVRNEKEGGKRVTFQCSVDYLRAEAADTGEYDGQDEPVFGPADKSGYPEYASVSVYKKGLSRPTTGTARWSEFYPGEKQGFMWRKMPFHMLAKCAEVLALRKAFPKRLAGLYIPEEMQAPDPGKPPLKEPQKKGAKAPETAKTDPPPENKIGLATVSVTSIELREGVTDGKPWKMYGITGDDGNAYKTFSETLADIANTAKQAGQKIRIDYKENKNGRTIRNMQPVEVEGV
jgi:phage recombination protein Bet